MRSLNFFIICLISATTLYSCSGLIESTRQSVSGDSPRDTDTSSKAKYVSKEQYDDLMEKYRELKKQNEGLKEDAFTTGDGPKIVDEIAANQTPKSATESVDVFGKDGLAAQAAVGKALSNNENVESDIDYFRKAMALSEGGKRDEALKVFQHLEKSTNFQVRVRASYQIGHIYMRKDQFDLALQVFEKIIKEDAFSGIVLSSLKGAVFCCMKLGLEEKKLQYTSIMKDVFNLSS